MTIEKTISGYNCFHLLGQNHIVKMFYIGHSKTEVKRRFKALVKEQKAFLKSINEL